MIVQTKEGVAMNRRGFFKGLFAALGAAVASRALPENESAVEFYQIPDTQDPWIGIKKIDPSGVVDWEQIGVTADNTGWCCQHAGKVYYCHGKKYYYYSVPLRQWSGPHGVKA